MNGNQYLNKIWTSLSLTNTKIQSSKLSSTKKLMRGLLKITLTWRFSLTLSSLNLTLVTKLLAWMFLRYQALLSWQTFYLLVIVAWLDQWLNQWALSMTCLLVVRQTSEQKDVFGSRLSNFTTWSTNAAKVSYLQRSKVLSFVGSIKDLEFTNTTMAMFTDLM